MTVKRDKETAKKEKVLVIQYEQYFTYDNYSPEDLKSVIHNTLDTMREEGGGIVVGYFKLECEDSYLEFYNNRAISFIKLMSPITISI